MITIHLKKGEKHSQRAFAKERIVIGSSQEADIIVNEHDIEAEHLLIVKEEGHYKAINAANDPFVSLNNLPFGKRTLKEGDFLSMPSLDLHIENFQESLSPDKRKPDPIEEEEHEEEFEEEEEVEPADEKEPLDFVMPTFSIRASHQEIEEILENFITPAPKQNKQLEQLEQFEQNIQTYAPEEEHEIAKKRTPILMWVMVLLMLSTVLALFLMEQQKITAVEEREAARGVADVAMTLLYAQMNHLNPSEVDWTSSASLRRLSRHVLYPRYSYAIHREGYDLISAGRHLIEVYYNESGDRFLVIARPQTLPWLTWQASPSIVFDSADMHLRTVNQMEPYTQFLGKNSYLKEEKIPQLTSMLSQEEVLSPSLLAQEGHPEFQLPLLLEDRRQEKNFIYNLPRYSPFTDLLIGNIIIQKRRIGATVNGRYNEQLKSYMKLKDLVFYTTQDLNKAIESLQGILPENSSLEIVKIGNDGNAVAAAVLRSHHEEIPATEKYNRQ